MRTLRRQQRPRRYPRRGARQERVRPRLLHHIGGEGQRAASRQRSPESAHLGRPSTQALTVLQRRLGAHVHRTDRADEILDARVCPHQNVDVRGRLIAIVIALAVLAFADICHEQASASHPRARCVRPARGPAGPEPTSRHRHAAVSTSATARTSSSLSRSQLNPLLARFTVSRPLPVVAPPSTASRAPSPPDLIPPVAHRSGSCVSSLEHGGFMYRNCAGSCRHLAVVIARPRLPGSAVANVWDCRSSLMADDGSRWVSISRRCAVRLRVNAQEALGADPSQTRAASSSGSRGRGPASTPSASRARIACRASNATRFHPVPGLPTSSEPARSWGRPRGSNGARRDGEPGPVR